MVAPEDRSILSRRHYAAAMASLQRRLFVRINRVANRVVRTLGLKRFRGADLLFLTTVGHKSGKTRVTPLLYRKEPGRWIVVASNGGADWEPGWWLNVQAGSPASVEVDGDVTPVTGTEITGPEREELWRVLNKETFDYTDYQSKVSRRLAIVALTPVSETGQAVP